MEPSEPARQLGTPPLGRLLDDLMPLARRSRNRSEAGRGRFLTRGKHNPTPLKERWRFLVEGKVQGVGFRQGCCRRAMDLGLSGWVRNLPDGRVEVQAEGTPMALSDLRLWCERGPAAAQVSLVRPAQMPITGADWFEIRS